MRKFKVLVTGSSGYLGNSIIEELCTEYDFIGTDQNPGKNTKEVIDLRDAHQIKNLDKYEFEYVICTAWDQISKNIYENNKKSTKCLVTYLSNRKLKGIIFISSIYVSTPADIQYTRSKIYAENLIFDSSIPFIIIRPDMIYSIDEKKIKEQLSFIKKGFAICIGNGESLRTPTFVGDLVTLINLIIKEGKFYNKVYEIGSPKKYSQKEILKLLSEYCQKKTKIIHIPLNIAKLIFRITKKVDVQQVAAINFDRIADLQRLEEDFQFSTNDFETGIGLK